MLPFDNRDEAAPSRARAKAATPRPSISILRWGLWVGGVAIISTGALLAMQKLERFLIRDPRFALNGPAEYGMESPDLHLAGVSHASKAEVLHVFSEDFGRSVYLMPVKQRRLSLLSIDWVKDASVSRIWPNEVFVQILERKPVAFLPVPATPGAAAKFALIDADGVVLRPDGPARFTIPVVSGIRPEDAQPVRRDRIRRMMRLLDDLGPLGAKVSEVDVSDRDNLKVTESVDNRALVLMLGDRNFAARFQNFLNSYGEIRKRLPNAAVLDLRLEDRITVVEGSNP